MTSSVTTKGENQKYVHWIEQYVQELRLRVDKKRGFIGKASNLPHQNVILYVSNAHDAVLISLFSLRCIERHRCFKKTSEKFDSLEFVNFLFIINRVAVLLF